MQSVYLATKRYFDKTGGNSYFSSRIQIDGVEVARLSLQYGYESQDEYEALAALIRLGYLSPGNGSLYSAVKNAGAVLYKTPFIYVTRREAKAWGELG